MRRWTGRKDLASLHFNNKFDKKMTENSKKTWLQVLQFILQAAISALAAVGITSCTAAR
jgi:hypothetical protein